MKGNDKRKSKSKDKRRYNKGNGVGRPIKEVNQYKGFEKESIKESSKVAGIGKVLFGLFIIIGIIIVVAGIGVFLSSNNKNDDINYSGFTGKQYFKELGINDNEPINIIDGVDEAQLVESDGVCIAKTSIDGEVMYRFQVEKNGEQSYDMEISELMSSIHIIDNSEKANVKVSKRVYKTLNNTEVKINYYDIYVQDSKIKGF